MTWKKVNQSDAGTASKFGGNDLDKVSDAFNGADVSDPINFNVDINALKATTNTLGDILKSNGTKYVRLARGTANQVLAVNSGGTDIAWTTLGAGTGDITAGANVGTGAGQVFKDKTGTTLNFKRLIAGTNVTLTNGTNDVTIASTGGGGGGGDSEAYTYAIYIDPGDSSYKARNGITGAVDYSDPDDIGELINSITEDFPGDLPLSIIIGSGSFTIKSWDPTRLRKSNLSIKGQGRGLTKLLGTNDITDIAGDDEVMEIAGTLNTAINLTSNAPRLQQYVITGSTTGLAAGDWILIKSDEEWNSTLVAGTTKSEINRIMFIVDNGGGTWKLMLDKNLRDSYNTANTARISKINMLRNIHLADFTIEWPLGTANAGAHCILRLGMCESARVTGLSIRNAKGAYHKALVTSGVINSIFDDIDMEIDPDDFVEAGPYGISCRAACENVTYSNFRFKGGFRHAFTTTTEGGTGGTEGIPRNITITDCTSQTSGECAFDTHGEGDGIYFRNCNVFSGRSAGGTLGTEGAEDCDCFNTRSKNTSYEECHAYNARGIGFSCSANTSGIQMRGCHASFLGLGRQAVNIGSNCKDVIVDGMTISEIDHEGITIADGTENVQISNCVIRNVCKTNNTLPAIIIHQAKNVNLNNISIDTSNDPTNIVPITIESDAEGVSLSNVTISGAGKDCVLEGMDIKVDHITCRGRNLNRPNKKWGRMEFVGAANGDSGLLDNQITATGGSKRIETTDGLFTEYSSSTLNAITGIRATAFTERDLNCYIRFVFRIEQTTGVRLFLLLSSFDSSLGPAGADPLVSVSGFGLKLDSGGSNFQLYHNSGDATTTTGANIAAVDANKHVFEIRSNYGVFNWRWDSGAWSAAVSTDIPASTTDLGIQAYIENNETGVTKTLNLLEIETYHENK